MTQSDTPAPAMTGWLREMLHIIGAAAPGETTGP